MKFVIPVLLCSLCTATLYAQTLQWGNEAFSMVTDSEGNEVNDGTGAFVFELGSFAEGFTPSTENIASWHANWHVFDTADYETDQESGGAGGVFTSTVNIVNIEGAVRSNNPTASTMDFSGLEAYIWVRKGNDPVAGSEWLLARAVGWEFPTITGGCCDLTDWQWSTSDLLAEESTPLWGRQNGFEGGGVFSESSSGYSNLQTYTFIPEPSAFLLSAVAGLGFVLRRRRTSAA